MPGTRYQRPAKKPASSRSLPPCDPAPPLRPQDLSRQRRAKWPPRELLRRFPPCPDLRTSFPSRFATRPSHTHAASSPALALGRLPPVTRQDLRLASGPDEMEHSQPRSCRTARRSTVTNMTRLVTIDNCAAEPAPSIANCLNADSRSPAPGLQSDTMISDAVHLRRATSSLGDAGNRVARVHSTVGDHLSGAHAMRLEKVLSAQRTKLVRAERDLEEVLAVLVRAAT